MRISDSTIRKVQETADVLEVVEDYLPLKKKGQNWWALSPFTEEKTPSFSVNPAKGIYKCFSTGKGGDAISFVMEMDGLGFLEAIRQLAKKYSIEVEEEGTDDPEFKEKQDRRESIRIVLKFARDFFQKMLLEHEDGKTIGLSYFRERGFSQKTIEKFELGYSLDQWDGFEKEALKKGYQQEIIEAAGLVVRKEEGKHYDRFRGRVMFPIHDTSGRVLGFGARTLKKDDKPKYLNSPETEVYHKSDVLYGIFQAKNAIRNDDMCYLVEGYTDVISLHQAGIENVVASSGTSLTDGQVKLIKRLSNNITVLYDGDKAGISASLRGVDMILEKGLDVRIVTFPEGEDPDSYVQQVGGAKFKEYLKEKSQDFVFFKTSYYLEGTKNDPLKKAEAVREVVTTIAKIPDPIKRALFFRECSEMMQIDEGILIDEANKIALRGSKKASWEERKRQGLIDKHPSAETEGEALLRDIRVHEHDAVHQQERETIRILLEYGEKNTDDDEPLALQVLRELGDVKFHHPVYRTVHQYFMESVEEYDRIPMFKDVVQHCPQEYKQELVDLITEKGTLSDNWAKKGIHVKQKDEILSKVVFTNIMRLKFRVLKKMCNESLENMKNASNPAEEQEALEIYFELKKQTDSIARDLGIVVS